MEKIFGTHSERELKLINKTIDKIESLKENIADIESAIMEQNIDSNDIELKRLDGRVKEIQKEYLNVKDNELIMYKTKEELIIKLENALKKCAENSRCLSSIASQNIKFSKFFSIENNYNSIIKELNRR